MGRLKKKPVERMNDDRKQLSRPEGPKSRKEGSGPSIETGVK